LIEGLAQKYRVDLIMNACDPQYNMPIFDAAFASGCHYLDMAMSLSEPHPGNPFNQTGVKLGDLQFAQTEAWEKKGLLALVGMGVEPGMADVFARYAQEHLFDEIEEIGIRDGANLEVRGYEFAPNFSIWTTIEECLNPPVIWEKGKGWFTTVPFSEPEIFDFPEGIGKVECVNVEHEEVLLIPRWVKTKRVTFKYGLGNQFIGVLKTLKMLGLDNKEPINVKGVQVAPRDVVAACLPDPAHLGPHMFGKTCAGTWVKGVKDGKAREVYIYQVADNQDCMDSLGVQAVVAQTGVNAVIAFDLLAEGKWKGTGVLGPEAFDPQPFMDKLASYGFPYGIKEM
jgi:saccharopine dehydrogenase-like NADP-dependent oxidoreductase